MHLSPLIHMSLCPDKPILAGFVGSCAPCLAQCSQGAMTDVICLTRQPGNAPNPAMQSECIVREGRCLKKRRLPYRGLSHLLGPLAWVGVGAAGTATAPPRCGSGWHRGCILGGRGDG